jgi:hypothetical protein
MDSFRSAGTSPAGRFRVTVLPEVNIPVASIIPTASLLQSPFFPGNGSEVILPDHQPRILSCQNPPELPGPPSPAKITKMELRGKFSSVENLFLKI